MLLRQKETYIPVGDDGMHTEIGQEQPSAKTTLPASILPMKVIFL